MTRVVRLFRGNVRSDDVQQYGLEAEPLGSMSEKTAVQPTRVGPVSYTHLTLPTTQVV